MPGYLCYVNFLTYPKSAYKLIIQLQFSTNTSTYLMYPTFAKLAADGITVLTTPF